MMNNIVFSSLSFFAGTKAGTERDASVGEP